MPKIAYTDWTPGLAARQVIAQADEIASSYAAQGYDLTLRQLYYQFVARALIPNTQQSYKRLGDIVSKARYAGLLDWAHVVDRTRNLRGTSHWSNPGDIIEASARSFRLNKWVDQPTRVEVWVEKEALAGVVQRAANAWDLDWFSCRGYTSSSELWSAAQRLLRYIRRDQNVVILHLGDHDPSGLDMTRDIDDRLQLFIGHHLRSRPNARASVEVRRIALNMDQVEQYDPPPNPAKTTDSRAADYIEQYGPESWELDALDPATLDALIRSHVENIVDVDRYQALEDAETEMRNDLTTAARRWDEVTEFLDSEPETDEED